MQILPAGRPSSRQRPFKGLNVPSPPCPFPLAGFLLFIRTRRSEREEIVDSGGSSWNDYDSPRGERLPSGQRKGQDEEGRRSAGLQSVFLGNSTVASVVLAASRLGKCTTATSTASPPSTKVRVLSRGNSFPPRGGKDQGELAASTDPGCQQARLSSLGLLFVATSREGGNGVLDPLSPSLPLRSVRSVYGTGGGSESLKEHVQQQGKAGVREVVRLRVRVTRLRLPLPSRRRGVTCVEDAGGWRGAPTSSRILSRVESTSERDEANCP